MGESIIDIEFAALRGFEGIKEAKVMLGDKRSKAAVTSDLGNANIIIDYDKKRSEQISFY